MKLTKNDLADIQEVVNDFKLSSFELIKHDISGIGYTIDVMFELIMHERKCKVVVPATNVDRW